MQSRTADHAPSRPHAGTGPDRVALVAGAGGIIGKALLEETARAPGWRGLALWRGAARLFYAARASTTAVSRSSSTRRRSPGRASGRRRPTRRAAKPWTTSTRRSAGGGRGKGWRRITAGLVQPDRARAVGRGFGDLVFGAAFDVLSDTTKIRTAGLAETVDPAQALIAAVERQIAARILPRP